MNRYQIEVEWRGRGKRDRVLVVLDAEDPAAVEQQINARAFGTAYWPICATIARSRRAVGVYQQRNGTWRRRAPRTQPVRRSALPRP